MSSKNNLFHEEENNFIASTYTHTLQHSSTADSPHCNRQIHTIIRVFHQQCNLPQVAARQNILIKYLNILIPFI